MIVELRSVIGSKVTSVLGITSELSAVKNAIFVSTIADIEPERNNAPPRFEGISISEEAFFIAREIRTAPIPRRIAVAPNKI